MSPRKFMNSTRLPENNDNDNIQEHMDDSGDRDPPLRDNNESAAEEAVMPKPSYFVRSDEINSCDCENDIECMNCRRKKLFGNNSLGALPLPTCFPAPEDLPDISSFNNK